MLPSVVRYFTFPLLIITSLLTCRRVPEAYNIFAIEQWASRILGSGCGIFVFLENRTIRSPRASGAGKCWFKERSSSNYLLLIPIAMTISFFNLLRICTQQYCYQVSLIILGIIGLEIFSADGDIYFSENNFLNSAGNSLSVG